MLVLKSTNLAIRFAIEVALLGLITLWTWRNVSMPTRLPATTATPLAVAAIWTLVVHGDGLPRLLRGATEIVCFGLALAAVWDLGHPQVATVIGAAAIANASLLAAWNR